MKSKRIFVFLFIIFLLSVFSVVYPKLTGESVKTEYQKETAILERVVDGDTIIYRIGDISLSCRMLGINTPEKKMPYYAEAKDFLKQFENTTIELLRDRENTDKYNRSLRYVFYNSHFLNTEILEKGLASAYMTNGLKYETQLLRAEKYARENELGIWEKSTQTCAQCIKLIELNATKEYFTIENICNSSCALNGWFVKDLGRNTFWLKSLSSGVNQTFNSTAVWNNDADSFFMFDSSGKLVIYYSYSENL